MSAPSLQSTAILTEHLEYPPISLIDDIINAVNELLYKCTSAMEKYLLKKSTIGGKDYNSDIHVGITKLESLLEHQVDRNFDKLELYVLRNILRIPDPLIKSGAFRLSHQRDLPSFKNKEEIQRHTDSVIDILKTKLLEIEQLIKENQALKQRIKKLQKLKTQIRTLKLLVRKLLEEGHLEKNGQSSHDFQDVVQSLKPIDDTLKLLIAQLRRLCLENEQYCDINRIKSLVQNSDSADRPKSRSIYLERRAQRVLSRFQNANMEGEENIGSKQMDETETVLNIEDPDLSVL